MGIALIIILIIFLCWPTITKWVGRWIGGFVARRTEDYIRNATGMPPRPGSRQAKKQAKEQGRTSSSGGRGRRDPYGKSSYYGKSRRTGGYSDPDEPIIPKEYAEDVEYTETVEYSSTKIGGDEGRSRTSYYHESQVSDVEWEEIKPGDNTRNSK